MEEYIITIFFAYILQLSPFFTSMWNFTNKLLFFQWVNGLFTLIINSIFFERFFMIACLNILWRYQERKNAVWYCFGYTLSIVMGIPKFTHQIILIEINYSWRCYTRLSVSELWQLHVLWVSIDTGIRDL